MKTAPVRIVLPTLFGNQTVNSWLFKEPEPVLIDCGEKSAINWKALQKELKKEGLDIKDISRVIITHAHLDHMGMAAEIAANSNARIWVSDYAYDWAVKLPEMIRRRELIFKEVYKKTIGDLRLFGTYEFNYQTLSPHWDPIPEDKLQCFPVNGSLNFGGADWEVIYAPGHCVNQTCFYQKETKRLLSADMLLKIIPPPILDAQIDDPKQRTQSIFMLLDSYDQLAQMEISRVYPGHFAAFDNAADIIDHQRKKIHRLKEDCYSLIVKGRHTVLSLFQELYTGRFIPPAYFMVIGFIDLLLAENRIEAVMEDGILHYYPRSF